jgi:hypothetical protein
MLTISKCLKSFQAADAERLDYNLKGSCLGMCHHGYGQYKKANDGSSHSVFLTIHKGSVFFISGSGWSL